MLDDGQPRATGAEGSYPADNQVLAEGRDGSETQIIQIDDQTARNQAPQASDSKLAAEKSQNDRNESEYTPLSYAPSSDVHQTAGPKARN